MRPGLRRVEHELVRKPPGDANALEVRRIRLSIHAERRGSRDDGHLAPRHLQIRDHVLRGPARGRHHEPRLPAERAVEPVAVAPLAVLEELRVVDVLEVPRVVERRHVGREPLLRRKVNHVRAEGLGDALRRRDELLALSRAQAPRDASPQRSRRKRRLGAHRLEEREVARVRPEPLAAAGPHEQAVVVADAVEP